MKKHISGQESIIELMFIAIIADGHAILEGVPGVAKTTMTKALADIMQADFKRIQGTPDVTPSDIVGYTYLDEKDGDVKVVKGPVFTNLLLFDELNRCQPRVMNALLETLEERQVTLGGASMPLPRPFVAYATQNPLKIEGTVQLPKVLADRFLMRIQVDYPSMEEEENMITLKENEEQVTVERILDTGDILEMQQKAKAVKLDEPIKKYITTLVDATRTEIHVTMGASPRADLAFMKCGKAKALIEGRDHVTKDDIRFLANPILSHRLVVRSTGGIGVGGVINGLLATYT